MRAGIEGMVFNAAAALIGQPSRFRPSLGILYFTPFKSLFLNREFLISYRAFSISISLVFLAFTTSPVRLATEVNKAQEVAPGVWFHEGDGARKGHCNNGWIVFNDYILVVDGNFPSGAIEVLPKIKATSPNPIRFTFDTHHHGALPHDSGYREGKNNRRRTV